MSTPVLSVAMRSRRKRSRAKSKGAQSKGTNATIGWKPAEGTTEAWQTVQNVTKFTICTKRTYCTIRHKVYKNEVFEEMQKSKKCQRSKMDKWHKPSRRTEKSRRERTG